MTPYALVRVSQPGLAADMRELPASARGSLDRVAEGLERQGSARALTVRSRALAFLARWYGEWRGAGTVVSALDKIEPRLARWAACACAREVLLEVPEGETRVLRSIELAEAYLRGEDNGRARRALYAEITTEVQGWANAQVWHAAAPALVMASHLLLIEYRVQPRMVASAAHTALRFAAEQRWAGTVGDVMSPMEAKVEEARARVLSDGWDEDGVRAEASRRLVARIATELVGFPQEPPRVVKAKRAGRRTVVVRE